jgi:hypothetical protein
MNNPKTMSPAITASTAMVFQLLPRELADAGTFMGSRAALSR